jgi:thiamine biosynthesis lipoprotein
MQAGYVRSFDEMSMGVAADCAGSLDDSWSTLEVVRQEMPALSGLIADCGTQTLCVPEGGGLDFGGVAKGWAAQQAMLRLKPAGPTLVSAGGDIAVSGPMANGEPWPIDIEDPFHGGSFLETIFLEGPGVATSGKDHRNWSRAGVLQHHVIDPRSGNPAVTDVLTATVIAPTVLRAEALAKAALILGSEAGMARLNEAEGVEGLLVLESGQSLYSRNFEKYL